MSILCQYYVHFMPKGLYEIGHFFNMGLTPAPLSNNVKKTLQDYYSEASLWEWKIKQDHLRWWVLHHSPHYYSLARFWVLGAIIMTIIRPYLEVPTLRKHNFYRGKKLPRWLLKQTQHNDKNQPLLGWTVTPPAPVTKLFAVQTCIATIFWNFAELYR